jgi:cysteine desulfurase/selenocysteine lyase
VETSLDLLLRLGPGRVEARVLSLAAMLHEKLTAAGIPPAASGTGPAQSHILTLGALDAGGHGFSSDPRIERLSAHLAACNIVHTIRRGQLRFGLHAYNDEADVERTAACVREGLRAQASAIMPRSAGLI